jgi:DNA repair protein SbcD/Mre11
MIRILLIADTHLGQFDDDYTTFERALRPALAGEVDLVVHGGDVFYRSRIKADVVVRTFAPLKRIADRGVPVVVVPGNHERSAIPFPLLAMHPGVHILHRPRTVLVKVRGVDVAVAGFPCERNGIEARFAGLLEQTGWRDVPAQVRLLCIHQSVEGATVGPVDYVFRRGPDVIPGRAIPRGFAAVLAGHIHRHQVLTRDLGGRSLAAPVFYPGSIERISAAERNEAKGFVMLELDPAERVAAWTFHETLGAVATEG